MICGKPYSYLYKLAGYVKILLQHSTNGERERLIHIYYKLSNGIKILFHNSTNRERRQHQEWDMVVDLC